MSSIRALWIFCLLAAILAAQTVPATAEDSATNVYCSKMVRAYIQKARRLDRKGDLAGARNDVFLAWFFYGWTHTTKFMATGELSLRSYEYLFPQGKAFCLFDWIYGGSQSRLIYAKVRGDTFAVMWQALLEKSDAGASERNTGHKGVRLPFVSFEDYGIVREWGNRPPADTPLVFFRYMWVPDTLIYGRIDSSGAELPMGGWNHKFPPTQWLKYRVPYRMPTRREYLKERPQQYGPVFIDSNVGGQFVPNRPGSRSGHLVGQTFELPKIPGETASHGEVPPNKSGGKSSSASAAGVPANTPSGSIGWTWASHPVTVGYVMRHTDAKHPATIGVVHVKAEGLEENWRVEVFRMDSAGGVKCVVLDVNGNPVAVTLVMIGQFVKGNYGHRVGVRLFRTDVDRWPKEYVWGGGGAKRDGVAEGQTKSVVVLSRVLQFPGHLNLGVAEWP